MKNFKLSLIFFLVSLNANAWVTLSARHLGNLTYSVSEPNRLIFIEPTFSAELSLTKVDDVPDEYGFLLGISGEYDKGSDQKRELAQLVANYPGYNIQTSEGWVKSCTITTSFGSQIPCTPPPANGHYFNAFATLDRATGTRLKTDIAQHRLPVIRVEFSYSVPQSRKRHEVELSVRHLCTQLVNPKTQKVTLASAIAGVANQLSEMGFQGLEQISQGSQQIMERCLDSTQGRLSDRLTGSAHDLASLMATELTVQENLPSSWTLRTEELVWTDIIQSSLSRVEVTSH